MNLLVAAVLVVLAAVAIAVLVDVYTSRKMARAAARVPEDVEWVRPTQALANGYVWERAYEHWRPVADRRMK